MITFYNAQHVGHQGKLEMFRGELVPCFEVAQRVETVVDEVRRRGLGPIQIPEGFSDSPLARIHSADYLAFLREAWGEWVALNQNTNPGDILPSVWPGHGLRRDVQPENFSARLGRYSFDIGSPLTAGTWSAAQAGAWCALSAAEAVLSGGAGAFALTRPPGHHAGRDFFGGYCFINNAAIAAQALRDGGAPRVAILDVDYHHGNGTQSLFYDRADVLFVSLHGDPSTEYPFYLGYADEEGMGPGRGYNLNLPLPRGTDYRAWSEALAGANERIVRFAADVLVVSLGVDTFEGDPISGFRLRTDDFLRLGEQIASLGLPTVFVFEGGYAVQEVGLNTANVLEGFLQQ